MPVSLTNLFRCLILLLLCVHVFYMYGMARMMSESFGFDWRVTGLSIVFAILMLIPFVWAVGVPELPVLLMHWRRRRRFARGHCPQCDYQITGVAICPECGRPAEAPPSYRLTMGAAVRFAIMNLAALIVGITVAETSFRVDEIRFVREALASGRPNYARPRLWPWDSHGLVYSEDRGFSAHC